MRIDFHVHAALAKAIGFEIEYFRETLRYARSIGLDALAITDHHNTNRYDSIFDGLDREFEYGGSYYEAEGVRLYPGLEVDVAEGPHLLLVGDRDDVRSFRSLVVDITGADDFVRAEEFFASRNGQDFLTIHAHPRRTGREIERLEPELLGRFDAIDLNAKDLWSFGIDHRETIDGLGRTHDLPVVAGSDAHHYYQLGSVYNEFHQPFESVSDLRELISQGAYDVHVHDGLATRVDRAREAKRSIKAGLGLDSSAD